MAPSYRQCFVTRSDGQLTVIARDGTPEPNQPTAAQLDDTPIMSKGKHMVDCYKQLADDDAKAVEWKRKLGGMLMNLLAKGNKEHISMVWSSRSNYISNDLQTETTFSKSCRRDMCYGNT